MKATLCNIPLFSGLGEAELEAIARIARRRTCTRGEIVFIGGEEAAGFFILVEGRVKVYKLAPCGREQALHIIEAGESFDEAAMFAEETYPAHAQALARSTLLFILRGAFLKLLVDHPQLDDANFYIKKMAQILKQASIRSITAAHMEVPCCFGLDYIVEEAVRAAGVQVPIREVTISVRGEVLGEEDVSLART